MKILVTHVPAGAGHQRAAEAVHLALAQVQPEAAPVLLNALDGADLWYRWTFTRGYLGLVDGCPALWGAAYNFSDILSIRRTIYRVHRWSNAWHGRKLESIFITHQPDVIIGTHFFPMEVAGFLKTRGRLRARLITVVTDYLPHLVWSAKGVDLYAVACAATQEELMRRDVPKEKIRVVGIPIDSQFHRREDRPALASKLGLEPDRFTVLITSGGFGNGPVAKLVQTFLRIPETLQLLIVAGNNDTLFRKLEQMRPRMHHRVKVYGFVRNMHELMSVSDVMVTKPGGLSCAEAIAKGLPMILTIPIPGQETRNARFIAGTGTGIVAPSIEAVPLLVSELQKNPKRIQEIAQRASEIVYPNPALSIARLAVP